MRESFTIEIEKIAYGGQGLGRAGGKVVFVPFTAPGDRVKIQVVREKKDYLEGIPTGVEVKSPWRVEPFCPLFGDCGGCQYQHLPYTEQLKLKEETVRSLLHRPPLKGDFIILPIIPSSHDRGYRIRAQLKGSLKGSTTVLGFYAWRTHKVVEIIECPLLFRLANEILLGLRDWLAERSDLSVRSADLQVSPDEEQGVVSLRIEGSVNPGIGEEICRKIKGVKGAALEGKQKVSWGELSLRYDWPEIGGRERLRIRSSGESFFQVNPHQNWNLMQKVVEWADLKGQEKVLDLFCGSGNLTLPLAQRAGQVWGVDQDSRAIEHAAENARASCLSNCTFFTRGAKEGIGQVREETRSVDVAVLDPPRAGAPGILDLLVSLRPQKILYVSCEPPTLARDLSRLTALGYNVNRVQPLDMFPQTYHVEAIVELTAVRNQLTSLKPGPLSSPQGKEGNGRKTR
ncbi:MAG TPA: 23S rRNA (uracil(1939)-C(5))-methyltransferase RlmD [Thermodesulfobacteriota bacterium]|nr:23S rRNA (uracil(1939)-C(5))-methyltransferase RlmD [Thermodesulfobacteriota bacterium]